jgi:hypothetical protein
MLDRFSLAVLNRGQLTASDFDQDDSGAVSLQPDARRRYLALWEEMLARRAPGLGSDALGADVDADRPPARRVARGVAESERPNDFVTWRHRMERQVERLRRFLMNGVPYRALFPEKARSSRKNRPPDGSHDPGTPA